MKPKCGMRRALIPWAAFVLRFAPLAGWSQGVPPLEIVTAELPDVVLSNSVEIVLAATNGAGGYVWGVPSVTAWGASTNVPQGLKHTVGVAAGHNSLVLGSDGTVTAWGWGLEEVELPEGLTNVMAVSAGYYHSLALREDGTVTAWGNGEYGQTNIPTDLEGVVELSAGGYHSLALKDDGTVAAWGDNYFGQATVPVGLSNVIAVAAGGYHSLALQEDGRVVAWGGNFHSQTNLPTGLSNVIAIAAGGYHSLALKDDGTVIAWGRNEDGQSDVPIGLSNVVEIGAGEFYSLARTKEGNVVAWGGYLVNHTPPPMLSNAVALAAGAYHSLALYINASELPAGLVLSADGMISGTAIQAGSFPITVGVLDQDGVAQFQRYELRVLGLPIRIDAQNPSDGSATLGELETNVFSVVATSPNGGELSYVWTWDGAPIEHDAPWYEYAAQRGDAGEHELRVEITDGLWTGTASAVWTVTVIEDNDGDGLPNWWEAEYFGSITGTVREADSDGDEYSNIDEYIAGTDPTDPMSVFEVESIVLSDVSRPTYRVAGSTNASVAIERHGDERFIHVEVVTNQQRVTYGVHLDGEGGVQFEPMHVDVLPCDLDGPTCDEVLDDLKNTYPLPASDRVITTTESTYDSDGYLVYQQITTRGLTELEEDVFLMNGVTVITTERNYDQDGRIIYEKVETYEEASDTNGFLYSASRVVTTDRAYDGEGRLIFEEVTTDAGVSDTSGLLCSASSVVTSDRTYDADGRLAYYAISISGVGIITAEFLYDPDGKVIFAKIIVGEIVSEFEYAYDDNGSLIFLEDTVSAIGGGELISGAEQAIEVSWPSVENREYTLEWRKDLNVGAWEVIEAGIEATPPVNTITNFGGKRGNYRVKVDYRP